MTPPKILVKRLLGKFWRRGPPGAQRRVILLYHSVGDTPWAVPKKSFHSQMEWLSCAATVVPLARLLEGAGTAPLQAAIAFDDGYAGVHDVAYPSMRDFRIVGTIHLNTACIGDRERSRSDPHLGHYPQEHFLLWREVSALAANGWAIGSHGVDHLDLTRQSDAVTTEQLRASKAAIEHRLSVSCDCFAYTWGRHTPHVRRLVANAGYRSALTGEHAPVGADCDPMAIPRIAISKDYSLDDFKAIVRGDWDYIGQVQKLRRRFA